MHYAQMHGDGWRPIAIGHISDSGDLKIIYRFNDNKKF